jgi:hypothetical protein
MDPNATLKRIRETSARIVEITDSENIDADTSDELLGLASELAELTQALDGWLSRGGFFPREWMPFLSTTKATI